MPIDSDIISLNFSKVTVMVESTLGNHKPTQAISSKDLSITNEQFYKHNSCMYFTDEVALKTSPEHMKLVNEFVLLENIGRGSYSKVKRVIRQETTSDQPESEEDQLNEEQNNQENGNQGECAEYAMKIVHKPTLRRERAIRYDLEGQMQMINNLDKIYSEIGVWTQLNHPYIAKLYEMIDDDQHDYIYLVLELADLGQIAHWNVQKERYERSNTVFEFVVSHLREHNGFNEEESAVEQVAQYLFRQLVSAVGYLHDRLNVIHRDIKPENVLFSGASAEVKLTDFTCSRGELCSGARLFDSEGTPCFTAPECHIVEQKGYLPYPTDIWSIGVCLYTYVCDGLLPFYGQSELEIQIASKQNELVIPTNLSAPLRDVLTKMLQKDPLARPTAEKLLSHEFFATD